MSEIRVKSENLFDISSDIHGYINSSGNFIPNNWYTATDYIEIPPNARTLYCSAITKSGQPVYTGLHVAVYDENKTLLTYNMDYNKSKISMSVDISLGKYFRADVCSEDYTECMVSFENVPYEPYFLNRPAHQKTSTSWKDTPTHIMTANGWQGELTSQSPLEFRATGQSLLDWRIDGKTSENLCERYTSVGTAQQYTASLYMFADIQPSTTYTIAFEIDEGSLQYFNENLFTYSQYYVAGTGNKQLLQLNAKANIKKTASTWSDTYGWIIAKNYTGNATVPHWEKIQLLKGTYTTQTIPPYEPYGGVGDWDETEQKYVIPVTVGGVTTNLYTDAQLMDGDSLDYTTDQTSIPITQGDNTLTVETAVQPSKVFVKFEG